MIAVLLIAFGIVNTMVSLKYEIDGPDECISRVSGQNLCVLIHIMLILLVLFIIGPIFLLVFRKRFIA